MGGAPTYLLTDNEKTVTTGHIAGVPVRNRAAVTFGRYYGISVLTCEPADPASKGGVENAVKLAKADIVPTETNLLPQYATFADVEAACAAFVAEINARVHRTTGRRPAEMLIQERPALHAAPISRTAALGVTRRVPDNTPMVTFEHCQYSLPSNTIGPDGVDPSPRRHRRSGDLRPRRWRPNRGGAAPPRHPGQPAIDDSRFPEHRDRIPGDYRVRARTASEQTFLAFGSRCGGVAQRGASARTHSAEDGPRGRTVRVGGCADVDWALGHAAVRDPLRHRRPRFHPGRQGVGSHRRGAGEDTSLAQGTSGWNLFGRTIIDAPEAVSHEHHCRAVATEVETLMRGLRLPHARAIAADVLATARAQRWDPTEVIKHC